MAQFIRNILTQPISIKIGYYGRVCVQARKALTYTARPAAPAASRKATSYQKDLT